MAVYELGELTLVRIPVASEEVVAVHLPVPHVLELHSPGPPPNAGEVGDESVFLPVVRPNLLLPVVAVEMLVVARDE